MTSVAVVDTNVVVAGVLTHDERAPTSRILDGMLQRRFAFALSEPLLVEIRAVLLRPKIRMRHKLGPDSIDVLLTTLVLEAIVIDPVDRSTEKAPDPGDQFLWDLLASLGSPILVTGDQRLLPATLPNGATMTPAGFCQSMSL